MALPTVKESLVVKNFKRLELCIEPEKKPLLKALLKMKGKNTKFDLEQIYKIHNEIFTKESLIETLYE